MIQVPASRNWQTTFAFGSNGYAPALREARGLQPKTNPPKVLLISTVQRVLASEAQRRDKGLSRHPATIISAGNGRSAACPVKVDPDLPASGGYAVVHQICNSGR